MDREIERQEARWIHGWTRIESITQMDTQVDTCSILRSMATRETARIWIVGQIDRWVKRSMRYEQMDAHMYLAVHIETEVGQRTDRQMDRFSSDTVHFKI